MNSAPDLVTDATTCDQLEVYEQFVDDNWVGGSTAYTMIALAGEVGEACNFHKKGMRQPGMPGHDPNWREKLLAEFGDAFYYLVRACHDNGTTLRAVMEQNQTKLIARKKAGGR